MKRAAVSDSFWSLVALGGRALASLVTFVILTRSLGDERFGLYVGTIALAAIAKPLSMVGTPELLARDVSRDPALFAHSIGRVVRTATTIGVAALAVLVAIGAVVIDELDLLVFLVLALGELVSYAVPETAAKALNALGRFRDGAVVLVGLGVGRALVAVALWVAGIETIGPFAWGFLGVSAAVGLGSWLMLPPERSNAPGPLASADGAAFAGNHVSSTVQNDVDKTMLVSISGAAEAGVYGAGYRLVQYSLLPVQSMLAAAYPRFFRRGEGGAGDTKAYAWRLAPLIVVYTAAAAALLVVTSGWLARIVGGGFDDVDAVIVAMCAFPTLFALQTVFGDALVTSGHERFRAVAAAGAAASNIGLNALLLPAHGWRGAVAATYAVEGMLLVVCAWRLQSVAQTERRETVA